MNWLDILKDLGIFTSAGTIIAIVFRSIYLPVLDKNIEEFKNKLQQEKIKFSKLHEKRAKYGTTITSCNCPDSIHRGGICYHRIAMMIMKRVYDDIQRIWLDELKQELW